MSFSGPMIGMISLAYRRVTRSSSLRDSSRGSTATPPFAPPYGMPISAHFQVIHIASARTSSRSVCGWKRTPPLAGPRDRLCCTRYPESTCMVPSSRRSGTATCIDRRGVASSSCSPSSRPSCLTASASWCSALSKADMRADTPATLLSQRVADGRAAHDGTEQQGGDVRYLPGRQLQHRCDRRRHCVLLHRATECQHRVHDRPGSDRRSAAVAVAGLHTGLRLLLGVAVAVLRLVVGRERDDRLTGQTKAGGTAVLTELRLVARHVRTLVLGHLEGDVQPGIDATEGLLADDLLLGQGVQHAGV